MMTASVVFSHLGHSVTCVIIIITPWLMIMIFFFFFGKVVDHFMTTAVTVFCAFLWLECMVLTYYYYYYWKSLWDVVFLYFLNKWISGFLAFVVHFWGAGGRSYLSSSIKTNLYAAWLVYFHIYIHFQIFVCLLTLNNVRWMNYHCTK